jgi:hypothetical protein
MSRLSLTILIGTMALSFTVLSRPVAADVFDDFSDGDYTANPSWTPNTDTDPPGAGSWTVNGGVLEQTQGGGSYGDEAVDPGPHRVIMLDGSAGSSTYVFEADMGIPSGPGGNAVGVAFHIQDFQNMDALVFFPGYPGGAVRHLSIVNGTSTIVSDTSMGAFTPKYFPPQVFHTMRLEIDGADVAWTASGITNTDDPYTYSDSFSNATFTSGSVGLINQLGPGFFDNVSFVIPEPATAALACLALPLLIRRGRA